MSRRLGPLLLLALGLAAPAAAAAPPASPAAAPPARSLVTVALDSMGGEARLRAVTGVHFKAIGDWTLVESSERPAPPWNRAYEETEQWLDFARRAWRQNGQGWWSGPGSAPRQQGFELVVADGAAAMVIGGKARPGSPVHVGDLEERLLYLPDRLLLAALDAADLTREADQPLDGQRQFVVSFHYRDMPVRLWIDARTSRPSAAEVVHALPDDYFWRVRGDVRDRLRFLQWTLHPAGLWYAAQIDLTRADIPYHSMTLTLYEPNAAPPERFVIDAALRAQYREHARGPASVPAAGEEPVRELAPGIVFAAAAWNTLLVGQPDGAAWLIDAPVSDVYFAREVEEAERRFGKRPAGLVLSGHMTPSLAGVREAAARGLPIYALDDNRAFVASLLAAPHRLAPDAWERASRGRAPRAAAVKSVAARTTVGTGATRVELIPMRTALGERVLLVWFPAARLLWTASALAVGPKGQASPSRVAELEAVMAREHLDVERVVGSQLAPTRWAEVQHAGDAATAAAK